mmetsp:Transcript_12749/g.25967  ORF Transcript_12749/g.25967 Transcript_12749/m.25967 type:complete len:408 (-) Transcript_12749:6-1229(-)
MSHSLEDSVNLVSSSTSSAAPLNHAKLLGPTSGALLLVAECVGTGILAMSYFTSILGGRLPTLVFLAANMGVNLYAGERLINAVEIVEDRPTATSMAPIQDLPSLSILVPTHTNITLVSFNTNLFLVLGAYLLTMEECLLAMLYPAQPSKLLLGSINVIVLISFNSTVGTAMSKLGRGPAAISIITMLSTLLLCLCSSRQGDEDTPTPTYGYSIPAAISGIAFAVGSQKLLLNVRAELDNLQKSRTVLRRGLFIMFMLYVCIIILSPHNAPGFLLDILKPGSVESRLASTFLFIHVAISFSINSQALVRRLAERFEHISWYLLTAAVATTILTITLLIPNFDSLTSLIGALTSIPLTLTLPLIFGVAAEKLSGTRLQFNIFLIVVCVLLTMVTTVASGWKIVDEWIQ